MIGERVSVALGQSFFPFRKEEFNKVQITLVPTGQPIPIDFMIQPVDHPSLAEAGVLICEGAQLLHPLALTAREVNDPSLGKIYLDPASRLDLSIQIPGVPPITGKIRCGSYEDRRLEWWYYDASLRVPRIKTPHFLPPPLPALATPGFLGPDPFYRVGESYGGKLLVDRDPKALQDIRVEFSLTNQSALPKVLAVKRELWEKAWSKFDWEKLYGDLPEKGLVRIYELLADSGALDPEETNRILSLIGNSEPRTAEEFIAQAEVVRSAACSWVEGKITGHQRESRRIWREEFFRF